MRKQKTRLERRAGRGTTMPDMSAVARRPYVKAGWMVLRLGFRADEWAMRQYVSTGHNASSGPISSTNPGCDRNGCHTGSRRSSGAVIQPGKASSGLSAAIASEGSPVRT